MAIEDDWHVRYPLLIVGLNQLYHRNKMERQERGCRYLAVQVAAAGHSEA